MYELRFYQLDSFDKVRDAFWTSRRVILVAPCGSGKTVISAHFVYKTISEGKKVWFIVHRKELLDQAEKTFKEFNIPMKNVSISMVQTLRNRLKDINEIPDLIVIDEAHHASSKTYLEIINKFPDIYILGLTATPTRMSGKPLGDIFQSMVSEISANDLIWDGYLADYDYYAPKIDADFSKAKMVAGDYSVSDIDFIMNKSKIYGDIIANYKKLADNKKTIIYCSSIAYSKKMEQLFNEYGYQAKHFDGDTPKKEREQIIENFRNNKIKILLNVDLLGEGFDVPDCECVILLRPTQSLSLYIQQSTRCLRPKESKKAVIIDFVGNAYRHGMPTEDRKWDLNTEIKCSNRNGEPEILVRQCSKCYKCYQGVNKICPYCGNDNGKTRREIEKEEKVELERIAAVKKRESKKEQGMARDFESLVALARKRGYARPEFWAKIILKSRRK